jgi:hypothetical protein
MQQNQDAGVDHFDLSKRSQLLADALAKDGISVSSFEVEDQMLRCLSVSNQTERAGLHEGVTLVPAVCLYDQYDLWIIRVAALTGTFVDKEDINAGAWPGSALPHTKAELDSIKRIVFDLIETQSRLLDSQVGVTALEVITRSLRTGESLEQCRSRAIFNTRGLRIA